MEIIAVYEMLGVNSCETTEGRALANLLSSFKRDLCKQMFACRHKTRCFKKAGLGRCRFFEMIILFYITIKSLITKVSGNIGDQRI